MTTTTEAISDSIAGRQPRIEAYDLYRLELPTGRMIGDCTCRYDRLTYVAVRLKTSTGLQGWGYGEMVSKGVFARDAFYIGAMPPLTELREVFDREWWPRMNGRGAFETSQLRRHRSPHFYSDVAVRNALWDLMAQQVGLPLYRLLGGTRDRVRAYGSLLDAPSDEAAAVALARKFVERGFFAVKVKVGDRSIDRDLQRLHAVRHAVGPDVRIAIDANEAWTWQEAAERVRAYEQSGLKLEYLEDPLRRDDVQGLVKLKLELDLDLVGHDYVEHTRGLRPFLEQGALDRLRIGGDMDQILDTAALAREFEIPLIFGNSSFEMNVHPAVALPNVDRLEFSDLAWNDLMREPVRFENGFAIAPSRPGHGLDPKPEALEAFRRESD